MPVEIKECYSDKPFFEPKSSVERLLKGIPQKYISGLATVIISDSDSLNHDRRREKVWSKGRKVRMRECGGLYHEAWKGEPAWIELFIDNMLPSDKYTLTDRLSLKFSFMRDAVVSRTLYHEIGHHIHKTKFPEYSEREKIAERWRKKLEKYYFMHKYPHIIALFIILLWPILLYRKLTRNKKGS